MSPQFRKKIQEIIKNLSLREIRAGQKILSSEIKFNKFLKDNGIITKNNVSFLKIFTA